MSVIMTSVDIRWAKMNDIPAIADFFKKAYGPLTIFSDFGFLRWYFGSGADAEHLLSIIAVTDDGRVVAHYGGIQDELRLEDRCIRMVWGVSAFTLLEYRGRGYGAALVQFLMDRYEVFGVIGFTPKTAGFYDDNGFHLFEHHRFHRHVAMLRPEGWTLAHFAGAEEHQLRDAAGDALCKAVDHGDALEIRSISSDTFPYFSFPNQDGINLSACRHHHFLRWRFGGFPYPHYEIFEYNKSWVVSRREKIKSTDFFITRIIDLYGDPNRMEPLLLSLLHACMARGDCLVDCSLFGPCYQILMENCGFFTLYGDDAALLPQVTHPAEPRPNHEYIGLFSQKYGANISDVPYEKAHFTRMSSDRDRLSRMDQINMINHT